LPWINENDTGLSEPLSHELAPFNIRILIVEPGAFRTNFLSSTSVMTPAADVSEAYKDTPVGLTLSKFDSMNGKQRGDTEKGVKAIFDVVMKSGQAEGLKKEYMRLPLRKDCVERYEKVERLRGFGRL
jgi:NAD(P)-dependent dehydrogenase (short-subunit alcohol dehydrogenase family)